MNKLTRSDLLSLEQYALERQAFRGRVMAHKRDRLVEIGAHAALYFEDRLTMRYQIQEMLRAERIYEPAEIEAELSAYNPLIPDGNNWKATFMLQYGDEAERHRQLVLLKGIESEIWVQVVGQPRVTAIADEDLERENEEKTSAVHFLRFELGAPLRRALADGAGLSMGISHPAYTAEVSVSESTRLSLMADFDPAD